MSRLIYDEDGRGKRYVSEAEALRLFLDLPEPDQECDRDKAALATGSETVFDLERRDDA